MATEVGRIVARYIADTTSFDRGNARVKAGLASTERSAKRGRGLQTWAQAGKYGILGVGAAVVGSVKSFANFDRNMHIFQANTDATGRTMELARKTAVKFGADARFPAVTAAHVADAMVELSKAGLTAKQSIGAVGPVMLLGTAGQMDFADAGNIAANAMNAFHLKARQLPAVVDDIAGAALKSSSDVKDIAEAFRYTSSSAHMLGVPIKQVTTMAGMLSNLGLKGDMAGTSMRMFFTSIAKPRSAKAVDQMEQMGLMKKGKSAFFDKKGEVKSMGEIAALWKHATAKMTRQQRVGAAHTIFGVRGMNVAAVLMKGQKAFEHFQARSTKAGSANKLAAANTKGLYGAYQRLVNVIQTLGLELGEKLAPTVERVLNTLSKFAGKIEANKRIVSAIAKAIIYVTAAYVAWRAIQVASTIIMGIARAAMVLYRVAMVAMYAPTQLLKIAQMELNAAFLANPIGILIVAIIAIILILRHFGVGLDDVKRIALNTWHWITKTFHQAVYIIGGTVNEMINKIKSGFFAVLHFITGTFHKYWKDALIVVLAGPFAPLALLIKHNIKKIKDAIHGILSFLTGLGTSIWNTALALGKKIIDAIIAGVKSAPGKLADAIISMIPGGGKAKHLVGKLFGRAGGGPVTGGHPYIVGEKGPEWFVPRNNGTIIPHGQGGKHGGAGATVNIQSMSVRSDEDAYVVASILGRRMALGQ